MPLLYTLEDSKLFLEGICITDKGETRWTDMGKLYL